MAKPEKRSRLELEGTVIDDSNGRFKVKVSDNHIVSATISGKIRQNAVKILVGDSVKIEVSPFDTNMGRIIYRIKS